MTGEIINLRRARKARMRDEAEREAARNRTLYGRSKAERARDTAEQARADQARTRLEQGRIED